MNNLFADYIKCDNFNRFLGAPVNHRYRITGYTTI